MEPYELENRERVGLSFPLRFLRGNFVEKFFLGSQNKNFGGEPLPKTTVNIVGLFWLAKFPKLYQKGMFAPSFKEIGRNLRTFYLPSSFSQYKTHSPSSLILN